MRCCIFPRRRPNDRWCAAADRVKKEPLMPSSKSTTAVDSSPEPDIPAGFREYCETMAILGRTPKYEIPEVVRFELPASVPGRDANHTSSQVAKIRAEMCELQAALKRDHLSAEALCRKAGVRIGDRCGSFLRKSNKLLRLVDEPFLCIKIHEEQPKEKKLSVTTLYMRR
ncbi:unnamed protein product [Amoebophrya sp. A120]|nr:unnamed protein product [Amoebophrya sp. A120]|eukprot:GSA120T00024840001.1